MTPKIVGFTGFRGSGKGTVAKFITEELLDWTELNYADPLKRALMEIFGWTKPDLYDPALKDVVDPRWGISRRTAMQHLGTQVMRQHFPQLTGWKVGDNFWIERMRYEIEKAHPKKVVIADIRFQNEVDLVHELGGKVFEVWRDSKVPENLAILHASERIDLLKGVDGIIPNNSDIRALYDYLAYDWDGLK